MEKIDNLKKILLKYEYDIKNLIKQDNKKYNQNIDLNIIDKYIKNLQSEESVNQDKSYIVIYNGNPEITLYLSINAILKNKNIIFMIQDDYFENTNKFIIDLFNKILKANSLNNILKIYFNCDEEKVLQNSNMVDKIMYIDDKYNLNRLIKESKVPVIYHGYNTIYVYYEDTDKSYNLLNEIDAYCKYNNMIMQTLEDDDIIESIRVINKNAENYMCIILSDNEEKQEEFKNRVRSEFIAINENPFKNNNYIFRCEV